jgi:serine/threonine-protein kinase
MQSISNPDPEPAEPDLLLGKSAGSYQIVSLLGQGGMGKVYLAEHPTLKKKAAVKVLSSEGAQKPQMVERFLIEARAVALLKHENIVDVIDCGTLDGLPYFIMEHLEGETLEDLLERERQLSLELSAQIALQVLIALEFAHSKQIIHRDLKPGNIFLVKRHDRKLQVKILDFGIAKVLDPKSSISDKALTKEGAFLGTPHYMSPEQAKGENEQLDQRTDIYSLGIILFEMLCGQRPFVETNLTLLVVALVTQPPPSPRSLNPFVSTSIDGLILKALRKEREERFEGAEEMAEALREALKQSPEMTDELRGEPTRPSYFVVDEQLKRLRTQPPQPLAEPIISSELPPRASTLSELSGEVRGPSHSTWKLAGLLGACGVVIGAVLLLLPGTPSPQPAKPSASLPATIAASQPKEEEAPNRVERP